MPAPRLFVHVQHLLGSGHVRRATALAAAFAEAGWEVDVASGGFPVAGLPLGGARLHQLPPLRATGADFETLVDEHDGPVDDAWQARRRAALLELFESLRPDVLIVEMFPFGRRQLRFELLPLLEAARTRRCLVVSSVRDVLVRRPPEREREMARDVNDLFDAVLVHGDPDILPFEATFGAAEELAGRLHYTGYIAGTHVDRATAGDGDGEIIISAGSSAVGRELLRAAANAFRRARKEGERWRILVGGRETEDFIDVLRRQSAGGDGLVIEPARDDFRALLARCAVSVSQAGYNTVMDIVTTGAKAVLVPFTSAKETEQGDRARAFCALGYGVLRPANGLDGESLASAIETARFLPGPVRPLRTGGELASVGIVTRLLGEREKRHA